MPQGKSILPPKLRRLLLACCVLALVASIPGFFIWNWARTDDPTLIFEKDFRTEFPEPPHAEESLILLTELGDALPEDQETESSELPQDLDGLSNDQLKSLFTESSHSNETVFDEYSLEELSFVEKLSYLKEHETYIRNEYGRIQNLDTLLAELNKFEQISGFPPPTIESFPTLRQYRQIAKLITWNALLDADAGQIDQAFFEVNQMFTISLKSLPDSCSLIEVLNWNAVAIITSNCANELLDHFPISLNAISIAHQNTQLNTTTIDLFRRVYLSEITFFCQIADTSLPKTNILGVPLYLPNASANLYYELSEDLISAAEANESNRLESIEEEFRKKLGGIHIRNTLGRTLLLVSIPSVSKLYPAVNKQLEDFHAYHRRLASILETP